MKLAIFDLDGTVICSKHRQATLPCGNLNLAHWVENNTPMKIMRDRLLPLIHTMRDIHSRGIPVVICTARVLGLADYKYFLNNNVPFDKILSRPKGCTTPDAELKREQILAFLARMDYSPSDCEMWEDNESVMRMCAEIGIRYHDARTLNYHRE